MCQIIWFRRSQGDRPAPSTRRAAQQEVTQTDSLLSDAEGDLLDSYAAAMTDLPNKYRVLVLDSSYRPIEVTLSMGITEPLELRRFAQKSGAVQPIVMAFSLAYDSHLSASMYCQASQMVWPADH